MKLNTDSIPRLEKNLKSKKKSRKKTKFDI